MSELKVKKHAVQSLSIDLEDEFYTQHWDDILDLYYGLKNDYTMFGFLNSSTASEFYDIIYKCATITDYNKNDDDEMYDSDISDD